ncbi:hypothetical protein WR25_12430 [Diploscapter pachys]|uniref:Chitin synthase chs-1/2 N-terminal putative transporter domain-containing protein n=1 Tax=Diploscapter pachys TaxID=2018661 RepID=A0A2A2LMB1_9BILA|nr:hypothetical protein WR25_12430 [Diploscapter pachys]
MWFVWDHKRFFTNLIDEWMGEAPSDVFHFIPYVVNTKINVTESFEVGNYKCVNANFELSFTDFVPETIKVTYTIKGRRDMAIRSRFPVDSATAPIFATISQAVNCQNYAVPSNAGRYSKGDLVVLESVRSFGLCLLVFLVFPQLDVHRCILLFAYFPLVILIQNCFVSLSLSLSLAAKRWGAVVIEAAIVIGSATVIIEATVVIGSAPVAIGSATVIIEATVVIEAAIVIGSATVIIEVAIVIGSATVVIGSAPVAIGSATVIIEATVVIEVAIVIGSATVVIGSAPVAIGSATVIIEATVVIEVAIVIGSATVVIGSAPVAIGSATAIIEVAIVIGSATVVIGSATTNLRRLVFAKPEANVHICVVRAEAVSARADDLKMKNLVANDLFALMNHTCYCHFWLESHL